MKGYTMSQKNRKKEWKIFRKVDNATLNQLQDEGWEWGGKGCHMQFEPDGTLNIVAYRVVNGEQPKPTYPTAVNVAPTVIIHAPEASADNPILVSKEFRVGDKIPLSLLKRIEERGEERMSEFKSKIRQTVFDTANEVYAELSARKPMTWDEMVAHKEGVA